MNWPTSPRFSGKSGGFSPPRPLRQRRLGAEGFGAPCRRPGRLLPLPRGLSDRNLHRVFPDAVIAVSEGI